MSSNRLCVLILLFSGFYYPFVSKHFGKRNNVAISLTTDNCTPMPIIASQGSRIKTAFLCRFKVKISKSLRLLLQLIIPIGGAVVNGG